MTKCEPYWASGSLWTSPLPAWKATRRPLCPHSDPEEPCFPPCLPQPRSCSVGWGGLLLASPWRARAAASQQNGMAVESALLIIITTVVFVLITRGQVEQNQTLRPQGVKCMRCTLLRHCSSPLNHSPWKKNNTATLLCTLSLTPVPAVTVLYLEKLSRKCHCSYGDTDDVWESWLIFRVLKGNATFPQNN